MLLDEVEAQINEKESFITKQLQELKNLHASHNYQIIYKSILQNALKLLQQIGKGGIYDKSYPLSPC